MKNKKISFTSIRIFSIQMFYFKHYYYFFLSYIGRECYIIVMTHLLENFLVCYQLMPWCDPNYFLMMGFGFPGHLHFINESRF